MLEALLYPEAVGIVGASRTPGKVGHELVANLLRSNYAGRIIPVNPAAAEILGLKCYRRLAESGVRVDLSLIAVPAPAVLEAVDQSIEAGARAIVVITAGFRETGEEGARLEAAVAERCRRRNVRLLGPNCLGLINTHHNLNASFAKKMPKPGGISFISQSGALCTAILDWALARHLGMAKVISMGNKADLNENHFLTALASEAQTRVVVGYLESISPGNEFLKAAEAAASRKPVILFKSGVTQA
ncbi:MAG: CoA-binding protein, partial [Kiritimatiellae bacterium]|nr:CoA-binding protein [Kiritimatiellia bacterium]